MALYAMVLLITMVITGAGLALLGTARANRRVHRNIFLSEQAALLAQSGLDVALLVIKHDPAWRTHLVSGDATTYTIPNVGTIAYTVSDSDGDLADDDSDTATVSVSTDVQGAVQTLQASITPVASPALAFAMVANDDVYFGSNTTVKGPVRSNDDIWAFGTVTLMDDASFETVDGEWISEALQPASYTTAAIDIPAPDISFYTSQATLLACGGDCKFDKINLTPTDNTMGDVNPKGIYWINAGDKDVELNKMHLKGTLIIRSTGTKEIRIRERLWIEPADTGYPVLLIDAPIGWVSIELPANQLDEGDGHVDYNEDGDDDDKIDRSVKGLIWTNATDLWLEKDWESECCIIGNFIHVDDNPVINYAPELAGQLIPGFVSDEMKVVPGSIRAATP